MARIKTPYVYDRDAGRWRKGGRWAKAPFASQLRKDRLGRPLDASGRLVPQAALAIPAPRKARPKRAAKSKEPPRKKWVVPRERPKPKPLSLGRRVVYAEDGEPISKHNLISSVFENKRDPGEIVGIAEEWLSRKARRAGLDADELVLFQHGIQFVHTAGAADLHGMAELIERLVREFPQYRFTYSADIVHVFMGHENRPATVEQVKRAYQRAKNDLQTMWYAFDEYWDGEIGWFVEMECDELEGGS